MTPQFPGEVKRGGTKGERSGGQLIGKDSLTDGLKKGRKKGFSEMERRNRKDSSLKDIV